MLAANLFPNWISRAPRRLGALDFAILAVFGFGVISVVLAHEPWFDEAQGWLLAQDASVGELLVDFLRYEGHPPLWYMLLKAVGVAGLPYKAANVLSASLALLGVVLFLRLPSVPLVLRCLVPFGFFIAYQFTVVARAYAMLFPIMMGIATLYPQRRKRPVLFALLLVLLSEVGLYGLAMAWALAALHVLELVVHKVRLSAEERRGHLWATVLLVGHTLFMVAVLWPPPDLLIAPNLTQDSVLKRYLAVAGRFETTCLLGSRSSLASSLAWVGLVLWFWRQRLLATYLVLNLSTTAVLGVYFNVWHEGFFFHTMLLSSLLALQHGAARGVRRLAGLALLVVIFTVHVGWGPRVVALRPGRAVLGQRSGCRVFAFRALRRRAADGGGDRFRRGRAAAVFRPEPLLELPDPRRLSLLGLVGGLPPLLPAGAPDAARRDAPMARRAVGRAAGLHRGESEVPQRPILRRMAGRASGLPPDRTLRRRALLEGSTARMGELRALSA